MDLPYYQVDAFTSTLFAGNPAGVCLLEDWLEDDVLQAIGAENNLSETAFLVPRDARFDIRWFTPKVEVDLCGHATLASSHIIFKVVDPGRDHVTFQSKSGELSVHRRDDLIVLDFPSRPPEPCEEPPGLAKALGRAPSSILKARDHMAVYDREETVRDLSPDFSALADLDSFAVMVTAPGRNSDFVSRFFAPRAGIPEDPVTGSAHCTLVPYWAERLGKKDLHAYQVSSRGGELFLTDREDRVSIAGRAVTFLSGTIEI